MATLSTKQIYNIKEISPERITSNPENPRLVFRQEELDTLLLSIKKYGIQVPITVYEENGRYILIDGERRWRCAKKLNLSKIPALIQEKPTDLNNLLLMFNIHALREQWDYLTIASKLPKIIDLYANENGIEPNEIELSEITGLSRGQVRRCRLLLELPDTYRVLLFEELDLPKHKQRLSEDFFIEMERSLKTVEKRVPTAMENMDAARNAIIKKYRAGIINNIVDLRKVSKIATSILSLKIDETKAATALQTIFNPNNRVGINEVFEKQFEAKYDDKKIIRNFESILDYLDGVEENEILDEQPKDLLKIMKQVRVSLNRLLGS